MNAVKKIAFGPIWRTVCNRLSLGLLDVEQPDLPVTAFAIELLTAGDQAVPEWVRLLAPGVNRARDGRSYTVADAAAVVALSQKFKGAIDLLVDYEHQFDRAPKNGQPAPAAGWIKELAATGPDGSAGVWVRIDWLEDAAAAIRAKRYRYMSAVIAHDKNGVVQFVPRASLTNQPALDVALFSVQPVKEPDVKFLEQILAAFGLAAGTDETKAIEHAKLLATLAAALAKAAGVELSALAAMTADQVTAALSKPFADKIATLATAAKLTPDAAPEAIVAALRQLGVDPTTHVARSMYDDVAGRLAALTADTKSKTIEEAMKAGKLTPAMKAWAEGLDVAQLTAFLATAPVIVNPTTPTPPSNQPGKITTLTAEQKAEAAKFGVSEESYLTSLNSPQ